MECFRAIMKKYIFLLLIILPCLLFARTTPHVRQIIDAMWYDGSHASTTVTLNNLVLTGDITVASSAITLPKDFNAKNISVNVATITYLNALSFRLNGIDVIGNINSVIEEITPPTPLTININTSAALQEVIIPLASETPAGLTIDWGDGFVQNGFTASMPSHIYDTAHDYTIKIGGEYKGQFGGGSTSVYTWVNRLDKIVTFGDKFRGVSFYGMFSGAFTYNKVVWHTRGITPYVTDTRRMFYQARAYNQALDFDTSNVTDMSYMFWGAYAFNQPLSLDTSKVKNMESMFFNAWNFNQPLDWNTSSVTNMKSMFQSATDFDQNLGNWQIPLVANMTDMFKSSALSSENYAGILNGWSSQTPNLQMGVSFHAGTAKYPASAKPARDVLTLTHSWIITDGGQI
jgi:hypothetical protein